MIKKKLTKSQPAVEPDPKKHAPAVKKTAKVVASAQVAPKLAAPIESPAVGISSQGSIASLAEAVKPSPASDPERIAQIAYLLWLERGCPQGSPAEDWFRAEAVLYGQTMSAVA